MLPRLAYARGRLGRVVDRLGDRQRRPEELDPGRDVAEEHAVDAEGVHRARLDAGCRRRRVRVSMARSANGMDRAACPAEHQVGGKTGQHPRLLGRRRACRRAGRRLPRAAGSTSRCRRPATRRSRAARGRAPVARGWAPASGAASTSSIALRARLTARAASPITIAADAARVEDVGQVAVGRSVRAGTTSHSSIARSYSRAASAYA